VFCWTLQSIVILARIASLSVSKRISPLKLLNGGHNIFVFSLEMSYNISLNMSALHERKKFRPYTRLGSRTEGPIARCVLSYTIQWCLPYLFFFLSRRSSACERSTRCAAARSRRARAHIRTLLEPLVQCGRLGKGRTGTREGRWGWQLCCQQPPPE
jgi:hypothetical protein